MSIFNFMYLAIKFSGTSDLRRYFYCVIILSDLCLYQFSSNYLVYFTVKFNYVLLDNTTD